VSSGASCQSQISLRYAAALLDLAEESKVLNAVEGDLHNIKTMIASCNDLSRLLHSPVLSCENQRKALAAVLDKAKISDLTKRFAAVVAGNPRL
jgi:F-type H+-transporting ATPase subunit delta